MVRSRLFGHNLSLALAVCLLLFAPLDSIWATEEGRTSANLCRGCHGNSYTDYVSLSLFSAPTELESGESGTVSVRMDVSGNMGASQQYYWDTDVDVSLSSTNDLFSIDQVSHSWVDLRPGDYQIVTWQITAKNNAGIDTITVEVFGDPDHYHRTGTDTLTSNIEITTPNHPPTLTDSGFSPEVGNQDTLFHFFVNWTDLDGDLPSHVSAIVDDDISLELFAVDTEGESPQTGMRYQSYATNLPLGEHTYHVSANDGEVEVRFPPAGFEEGPFVGAPPNLSNNSFNPPEGNTSTNFTFTVYLNYTEYQTTPTPNLWLNGELFGQQPQVTPISKGIEKFEFHTTLSDDFANTYHFEVSDMFGSNRFPATGEFTGPVVESDIPPPTGSGHLSNASHYPLAIDDTTVVNFSVEYSHTLEIPLDSIIVVIDDQPFPLECDSEGDLVAGIPCYHTKVLTAGNHSYRFEAAYNQTILTIPSDGSSIPLQVSRFDTPSILQNGTVSPNDGGVLEGSQINFSVAYFDAENDSAYTVSVFIDGLSIAMEPLLGNPMQGHIWVANTTQISVGSSHLVWFVATNSMGETLRFPSEGGLSLPEILPQPVPNIPPTLQPSVSRPTIYPPTGQEGDMFTFTIVGKDLDYSEGDSVDVLLILNGDSYQLTYSGGSISHGAIFNVTLALQEGDYSYYFTINDGNNSTSWPSSGEVKSGPIVSAKSDVGHTAGTANVPLIFKWELLLIISVMVLIAGGIIHAGITLKEARSKVKVRRHNIREKFQNEDWATSEPDPITTVTHQKPPLIEEGETASIEELANVSAGIDSVPARSLGHLQQPVSVLSPDELVSEMLGQQTKPLVDDIQISQTKPLPPDSNYPTTTIEALPLSEPVTKSLPVAKQQSVTESENVPKSQPTHEAKILLASDVQVPPKPEVPLPKSTDSQLPRVVGVPLTTNSVTKTPPESEVPLPPIPSSLSPAMPSSKVHYVDDEN